MKQISLSILILLLTIVSVDAQRGHGKMKKNPEAKAAMDELYLQKIVPVMTAEQAAFDQELSPEDRQFIQAKRIEAIQNKEKQIKLRKELKATKKEAKSKEAFRESVHALRKDMHQMKKATAESLTDFIERNNALIESTMERMKPKHEEWRAERKAIHEKYKREDAPARKHHRKGDHPRHHGEMEEGHRSEHDLSDEFDGKKRGRELHHGKRKGKRGQHGDKVNRGVVKFLLWSAKDMEADMRSGDIDEMSPALKQNYPNPAKSFTTVVFNLPQLAENVVLTITNTNGQVVERKTFNQLEKGQHEYEVAVTDWAKGTYFYTIVAGDYRASKTMIVVD